MFWVRRALFPGNSGESNRDSNVDDMATGLYVPDSRGQIIL